MEKNLPRLFLKTCACGKRFFTERKHHDTCRGCMRTRCQVRARMAAPVEQRDELRDSLREAFLAGTVPSSARVTRNGSQVVVVWQGRSHTFHVSDMAFAVAVSRRAMPTA